MIGTVHFPRIGNYIAVVKARQVLAEADRIRVKHLATLEPAISPAQTDQMQAHNIQLVIPTAIQSSYLAGQQSWLWSIGDFIEFARLRIKLDA